MAQQAVTYAEAMNQAFKEEMRRDENVVMWGEDLISVEGFTVTRGIYDEFGPNRILDTPIVEDAIVGMATGAACVGMRPIAHLMMAGFMGIALDQVFLKLGANYQMWSQLGPLPVVVFSMITTDTAGYGLDHALSPEALLIHSPGLKVVMPATAYDAKGLLKSAIRDDRPVVFMPHWGLFFNKKESIPVEEYLVPIGKADIKRTGKDVTIVSYSAMLVKSLKAAEKLSQQGIDAEVVDLRTLVPLDIDTVVKSVQKTRRLLIAHEAMKRGGVAGEITLRFIEAAPDLANSLKSPIKRVAGVNMALPHGQLEKQLVPQEDTVVDAVKEMM